MRLAWMSPFPLADRVALHIANTSDFAWVFLFAQKFPEAEIYITGKAVRESILGRSPNRAKIFIKNITKQKFDAYIAQNPPPPTLTITHTTQPITTTLENEHFTLNACAYHLNNGTILDPYHGIAHTQTGELATTKHANEILETHPLQAFRALRLCAQFNLTPSVPLWKAILQHAPRVRHITFTEEGSPVFHTAPRHLAQEGIRTLKTGMYGWNLLKNAKTLVFSFPHLEKEQERERYEAQLASTHTDSVRTHYANIPVCENLVTATLYTLHTTPYAQHAARMEHHHIGNEHFHQNHVQTLLNIADALLHEQPHLWSLERSERMLQKPWSEQALALAHIATLHNQEYRGQAAHIAKAALMRDRLVRDVRPGPLMRGRDLQNMGIASGYHIRDMLKHLRNEQLKGTVTSPAEARMFMQTLVKKY